MQLFSRILRFKLNKTFVIHFNTYFPIKKGLIKNGQISDRFLKFKFYELYFFK